MGRKLVLVGSKLTDLNAPKLVKVDAIESAGSLLLLDPAHPTGGWAAGVPANGDVSRNLFASTAATVTGGTPSAMQGKFVRGAGWDGTKGFLERTGKGGLHGVVSTTAADLTTVFYNQLGDGLKAHLLSSGHAFFFSIWSRVTRESTGNGVALLALNAGQPASGNYLANYRLDENLPNNGRIADHLMGNKLVNGYSTGWTGTQKPSNVGGFNGLAMVLGGDGTYNYMDSMAKISGSRIYYRYYIEDLTVSGRSYSDVDSIDSALYTKEVLTAGGRYYNDSFSYPSALA